MHTARCPHCNVTVPGVAPGATAACPACGKSFAAAPQAGGPAPRRKRDWGDEDEPAPRTNSGRNTLLLIGGILLALLLVCGGGAAVVGLFVVRGIEAARQQAVLQVQRNQQQQLKIQANGMNVRVPPPLDAGARNVPATPLTLADAAVTHRNTLTPADPPFTGKPFKLFTVDLEPGRRYQIELASAQMDSFLRLYGPDDEPLQENDDFAGLNAGIVFTPDVAGTYKIHATVLGPRHNGPAPFTLTIRAD